MATQQQNLKAISDALASIDLLDVRLADGGLYVEVTRHQPMGGLAFVLTVNQNAQPSFVRSAVEAVIAAGKPTAVQRRDAWLARQVKEQRAWIVRCGGNEAGYIEHYGNPGLDHCYGSGGSAIYAADLGHLNDLEREAGLPITPAAVGVTS